MTSLPVSPSDELTAAHEAEIRSVYVHVPFCEHRCDYCDFSIIAGRADLMPRYLQALERELQHQQQAFEQQPEWAGLWPRAPLKTLYIGGGTPTLLPPAALEHVLRLLRTYFVVDAQTEWTIEANPDGFSVDKQQILADFGVNRISLGVQTFDDALLRILERTHSSRETRDVIDQLQQRFANLSLDLIFALPGQTREHWEQTLLEATQLRPQHLSTYALTFEKGTSFWGQRATGKLQSSPDVVEAAMYQHTLQVLPASGFEQYEISNFALPDFHSRHNDVYWTGWPYLAFGPGASGFHGGVRTTNHRSPFTWIKRLEHGDSPVAVIDALSVEERARELVAIGLRRNAGVQRAHFQRVTGWKVEELLGEQLPSLLEQGWLELTESSLRLTPQGRPLADSIACEII